MFTFLASRSSPSYDTESAADLVTQTETGSTRSSYPPLAPESSSSPSFSSLSSSSSSSSSLSVNVINFLRLLHKIEKLGEKSLTQQQSFATGKHKESPYKQLRPHPHSSSSLSSHDQILFLKGVDQCRSVLSSLADSDNSSINSMDITQYTIRVNHLINLSKQHHEQFIATQTLKKNSLRQKKFSYPKLSSSTQNKDREQNGILSDNTSYGEEEEDADEFTQIQSIPHAQLPVLSFASPAIRKNNNNQNTTSSTPSSSSSSASLENSNTAAPTTPSASAVDDGTSSASVSSSSSTLYQPRPTHSIEELRSRLFSRLNDSAASDKDSSFSSSSSSSSVSPRSSSSVYNPTATVEDRDAFASALADDAVMGDLSSLTTQLKDYVLQLNKALKLDSAQLENTNELMNLNLSHVQEENKRLKQWSRQNCSDSCMMAALIITLFSIFMAMVLFMKVVGKPH